MDGGNGNICDVNWLSQFEVETFGQTHDFKNTGI